MIHSWCTGCIQNIARPKDSPSSSHSDRARYSLQQLFPTLLRKRKKPYRCKACLKSSKDHQGILPIRRKGMHPCMQSTRRRMKFRSSKIRVVRRVSGQGLVSQQLRPLVHCRACTQSIPFHWDNRLTGQNGKEFRKKYLHHQKSTRRRMIRPRHRA